MQKNHKRLFQQQASAPGAEIFPPVTDVATHGTDDVSLRIGPVDLLGLPPLFSAGENGAEYPEKPKRPEQENRGPEHLSVHEKHGETDDGGDYDGKRQSGGQIAQVVASETGMTAFVCGLSQIQPLGPVKAGGTAVKSAAVGTFSLSLFHPLPAVPAEKISVSKMLFFHDSALFSV